MDSISPHENLSNILTNKYILADGPINLEEMTKTDDQTQAQAHKKALPILQNKDDHDLGGVNLVPKNAPEAKVNKIIKRKQTQKVMEAENSEEKEDMKKENKKNLKVENGPITKEKVESLFDSLCINHYKKSELERY